MGDLRVCVERLWSVEFHETWRLGMIARATVSSGKLGEIVVMPGGNDSISVLLLHD